MVEDNCKRIHHVLGICFFHKKRRGRKMTSTTKFLILLSWLHFVLDYIKLSLLWLVSIANQTCILKFWFTHYNIIIFLRRLYAYHGYLRILFRLSSSLVFIVSFLNFITFERVSILFYLSLSYYIFLDFIVILKILLLL